LGFVGGALTNSSAEFAYVLIAIMIIHLIANSAIIYYLSRKTTISLFRTAKV